MSACRPLSLPDPSRVEHIGHSRVGGELYKFDILRSPNGPGAAVEITRSWKGSPDGRIRLHASCFVHMRLAIDEALEGRSLTITVGKVNIRVHRGSLLFDISRQNRFHLRGERIELLAEAINAAIEAAESDEET